MLAKSTTHRAKQYRQNDDLGVATMSQQIRERLANQNEVATHKIAGHLSHTNFDWIALYMSISDDHDDLPTRSISQGLLAMPSFLPTIDSFLTEKHPAIGSSDTPEQCGAP